MKNTTWKTSITRFLFAQTLSLLGSSMVQYAIIWHITLSTSSGGMLAISTLCGFVPQILISLFAGVWIDRFDRKKIILLSDSLIAFATLVLAIALLMGHDGRWLLFLALLVRSAGSGIQTPSVQAIIPQIVPKEHLLKINGINSTLSSMILFLSPVLSGAVLSISSLEACLFIDVITAVIGVGITATLAIPGHVRDLTASHTAFEEMKMGFSYLRKHVFIKRLLLFQVCILFFVSPSAFLTPLMVSRTFGAEIWRLTSSEMCYSLGLILGGLLITYWGGFRKKTSTILVAGATYGCVMIGLGTAPFFLLYLLLNAIIGITSPCYNAPLTATLQESVAPQYHGRIFSLMQMASSCALPLGMVFFGPLADRVAVQEILIVAGGVILVFSGVVWRKKYLSAPSPDAPSSPL